MEEHYKLTQLMYTLFKYFSLVLRNNDFSRYMTNHYYTCIESY